MGVFVGIIAGFVGATAFNKYYNYRKLPEALSFFNGKRFVPFVVIVRSAITALVLAALWPVVQSGINGFGVWIANSKSTAPILAPFLFGTFGTSSLAVWSSPHVDHSNQLYSIGWYLPSS